MTEPEKPKTFDEAVTDAQAAGREFIEVLGKAVEPIMQFFEGAAEKLTPPRSRRERFLDWFLRHQPNFYWFLAGSLATTLVIWIVHR